MVPSDVCPHCGSKETSGITAPMFASSGVYDVESCNMCLDCGKDFVSVYKYCTNLPLSQSSRFVDEKEKEAQHLKELQDEIDQDHNDHQKKLGAVLECSTCDNEVIFPDVMCNACRARIFRKSMKKDGFL